LVTKFDDEVCVAADVVVVVANDDGGTGAVDDAVLIGFVLASCAAPTPAIDVWVEGSGVSSSLMLPVGFVASGNEDGGNVDVEATCEYEVDVKDDVIVDDDACRSSSSST